MADVAVLPLVVLEEETPLVGGKLIQATPQAGETAVVRLLLPGRARGRPVVFQDLVLSRNPAPFLFVDQMSEPADVAEGIGRPDLDAFGDPFGDAVEGHVRQILGKLAVAPLEETDQLAADRLVLLGCPVPVGVEHPEESVQVIAVQYRGSHGAGHSDGFTSIPPEGRSRPKSRESSSGSSQPCRAAPGAELPPGAGSRPTGHGRNVSSAPPWPGPRRSTGSPARA